MTLSEAFSLYPIAQRTRLVDEVTHKLREMILSNQLAPGTPLRQIELAEHLGVSRTPLREALRILENDGLLTVSNRNRTVQVVKVTLHELRDMYEVREVIDGLAAKLLAHLGPTEQTMSELRHHLSNLADSESPYDPALRTDAHARFHALIAESSGNPYLASFTPLIRTSAAWLHHPLVSDPDAKAIASRGKVYSLRESMISSDRAHAEIVDAIESREPRRAEASARRHIRATLRGIDYMVEWQAAADKADPGRPEGVMPAPVDPNSPSAPPRLRST